MLEIRWCERGRLLAATSVFALALGLLVESPQRAEAAPCGNGSDRTISGSSCTGPFNWTGGNLSITNTGTISGGTQGVSAAPAGTLTNSGSISGASTGVATVSITSLVNSGTIVGTANYGLDLGNGTYGTIENGAFGTISGGKAGLYFQAGCGLASLSSLDNHGKITGGSSGISLSTAAISTLTNSGTISGGKTGIKLDAYSTISTLTNSGVISGPTYAINNSGSLGAITNSGTISGNIYNNSSNDLTISGGSGSTFGTLTGGTITNTASNLVFSSGNIWLQDDVNVTGHTLTNTGATVKLTAAAIPTITGTYNQSGGGLVIGVASPSSYGYMTVSGNATVANSTVTISGTGLTAGETFSIVRSGGTGSYTGDTGTVTGTNHLSVSISTVGQTLVVTLADCPSCGNSGGYQQKGTPTGSTGSAMGAALDRIKASGGEAATMFQNSVLTVIDALPASSQGAAIKQLAPTQNAPSAQMSASAANAVLGAVEQHQQTAMAYDPATGKAAGSDSHDTALWGQVLGGGALRGSNAAAAGYRATDYGLAVGLDNRFTSDAMAGVAVSWLRARSQGAGDASGSNSTLDSYDLTAYGTYRMGQAFLDGQASLGWNSFGQRRAIPFLGSVASANYDGQQYLARLLAGYDIPAGAVTLTPLAGLWWVRAVNDSYRESGAGAADLTVDRRGVNSLSHDLGAKLSFSLPTEWGTLKPEARAAWVHDYTHGPIATSGVMGGEAFANTSPRTVADGARIGLAATLNSDDAVSFRAEYDGELRHQYQSHTGMVKAIWGF